MFHSPLKVCPLANHTKYYSSNGYLEAFKSAENHQYWCPLPPKEQSPNDQSHLKWASAWLRLGNAKLIIKWHGNETHY